MSDCPRPSLLQTFLHNNSPTFENAQTLAFVANLEHLLACDPDVAQNIMRELEDQRRGLKLIASENYTSLAVQMAMGNWLSDKYAEGYPNHRFYAGCENVDAIESLAASRACELFGADHAFVQPHCGADANLLAFMAIILERVQLPWLSQRAYKGVESLSREEFEILRQACMGQKILGMSLSCGGHLTHGFRMNISSRLLQACHYGVDPQTGLIDYDDVRQIAKREQPLILLAGYSAYTRLIDFSIMRQIADEVGAVLMADMAHFAGLVAGQAITGVYNPIPYAHIVTTTTHKTLRGPRGGMVLCEKSFANAVNKACPMMMGGPLPHIMASKAICFAEALKPGFKDYASQICLNAKALALGLQNQGFKLLTGGTDNHMVLLDLREKGLNGKQAELVLRQVGITVNRNAIPGDPLGTWLTSGLRVGTPALTTLGMKEPEMNKIANLIAYILQNAQPHEHDKSLATLNETVQAHARAQISELKSSFALYPQIPSLEPWLNSGEKKTALI